MAKKKKKPKHVNPKSQAGRTGPRAKTGHKPPRRVSGAKPLPAQQGEEPKKAVARAKRTDVGPGRPPVEHQFRPGESGNPAGAPKARTNLYPYLCRFVGLQETEVRKIQRDSSQPLNRRTAARIALQWWRKGLIGVGLPFTLYVINRDEGKPTEHVQYEREEAMTPEECETLRQLLTGK